jgi:hypothetical protein
MRSIERGRLYTKDEYEELFAMKPEERFHSLNDSVSSKIVGILLAFSKRYEMRDGYIDTITVMDAEDEIIKLITDCGGTCK